MTTVPSIQDRAAAIAEAEITRAKTYGGVTPSVLAFGISRALAAAGLLTTGPSTADRIFAGDLPMPLCQNVSMAGRRRRYDQCDSTCTTDCGHCKGHGRPDELDRLVAAVDAGRDDYQRERAAGGGVA